MEASFVIDNSVVMSWVFENEATPYTDAILEKLDTTAAIVPSVWPLEVVNVLLVAERRQRLKQADSVRFITLLSQLPIFVEREWANNHMEEWLAIGRANNLSSYDASYLYLAMQKGLPLATLDQKLITAAQQVAIPLVNP
ncbi:MAG: type II toxin-antitoxin system VapC family toxin [Anaerolineales bacterium]|nr:type II toxin-antitoxin system VapC family toxin [Anaerolineales bacterium]